MRKDAVGRSNFTEEDTFLHGQMWLDLIDELDKLDEAGTPAICKQDPDLWFPEGVGMVVFSALRQAKTHCMPCPLRDKCLTYALVSDQREGMWGGETPAERKKIRKGLLASGQFDTVAKMGYLAFRRARLQAFGKRT